MRRFILTAQVSPKEITEQQRTELQQIHTALAVKPTNLKQSPKSSIVTTPEWASLRGEKNPSHELIFQEFRKQDVYVERFHHTQ